MHFHAVAAVTSCIGMVNVSGTYKTKLKLDKEVGGGVLLMKWICNLDVHTLLHAFITYPYA